MASIITLHKRQLLLPNGTVAKYAKVYFRLNNTTTQTPVYSDASCDVEFERSQPVICDVYGVMPVCYTPSGVAIRITATDENDVPLPGYGSGGMDDITPEPIDTSSADSITFTPTDDNPATNVQDAIENAGALYTDQADVVARENTVWPTAGTGNDYSITPAPAITAYAVGQSFWIRPDRTNTAAATLNVNGLGARAIQKTGAGGSPTALVRNDLAAYREVQVADDGTRLMILARRDDFTFGSDANGGWDRLGSGLMLCTGTITLAFATTSTLTGTWSFPNGGFGIAAKHCEASYVSLTATNVLVNEIGEIRNTSKSTTTAGFTAYRNSATHNFIAGDFMTVTVFAVGRL